MLWVKIPMGQGLRLILFSGTTIIKLFINNWVKVFKNRPSEICGRQPLKNLNLLTLPQAGNLYFSFSGLITHMSAST